MQIKSIRLKIIKQLFPIIKPYKFDIICLFIYKILLTITAVINTYLFKILIDDIIVKSNKSIFPYLLIVYSLLFISETIILAFQLKMSNRLFSKMKLSLRKKIFRRFFNFDMSNFQKLNIADLKMNIYDDLEVIHPIINSHILDYYICFIKVGIYFVILLRLNIILTICISLSIPIFFLITKKLKKIIEKVSEESRTLNAEYDGWLQNSLSGWKEIQTLNFYGCEEKKLVTFWEKLIKVSNKQFFIWFCNRAITLTKDFLIINVLLYFIGGILIINGYFTIGNMLIYISYFQTFFEGINEINSLNMSIHEVAPIFERIKNILNRENKPNSNFCSLNGKYEIQFKNIDFCYKQELGNILENINITLGNNENILIVGKSGEGKSTLIKLLLNFIQPQSGVIVLNECNINSIPSNQYYKIINASLQDNFLFEMSIFENLLIANGNATKEEVINACKLAMIHEEIKKLPNGYDTLITGNGENLSGGQKQRLYLARIILRDPQIIILDEATTALDIKTEKNIFESIKNSFALKTIIIISHNEDHKRYADRLILLENHKIIKNELINNT